MNHQMVSDKTEMVGERIPNCSEGEEEEQWNKIVDGNGLGDEEQKNKTQQRHQPFLKARGESDRSPWH